jgi:hypothetical protein
VNPSFQFDPTVGLVVIEFHNNAGALTNSIPTQKQLAAYRDNQATLPGEQTPPTLTPTSLTPPSLGLPQPANAKTSAG